MSEVKEANETIEKVVLFTTSIVKGEKIEIFRPLRTKYMPKELIQSLTEYLDSPNYMCDVCEQKSKAQIGDCLPWAEGELMGPWRGKGW